MSKRRQNHAGACMPLPTRTLAGAAAAGRRVLGAVSILAALAILGACEGDNLFSGDSPALEPRMLEVVAPQSAMAGDTITIRLTAVAPREVVQLSLTVRGAFFRDTVITIASPTSQVTRIVSVPVPTLLQDSVLVVEASVMDRIGAVGRAGPETVILVGPPTVLGVLTPDSARLQTAFTFTIEAAGGRPISSLLVTASGAVTANETVAVAPAARSVTRQVTLQVPAGVQDTVLRLSVAARDESGLTSPAYTVEVPLAVPGPSLAMVVPATALPGSWADVAVTASAMRGIASLRFELRGAVSRDTVVVVDPAAAMVDRSVAIRIPGDVTGSELRVRGFAVDAGGAVSAPVADTIAIVLGDPVIESLTLLTVAPKAGQRVDVRVVASGVRPLARVNVSFRGAADADVSFPVVPARTSATVDASVTLPQELPDTILIVRATAVDEAGAVSEIREIVVQVEPVASPPPGVTLQAASAAVPSAPAQPPHVRVRRDRALLPELRPTR